VARVVGKATSFPGFLIFPPLGAREEGGKMRDPGNKVVGKV